MSEQYDYQAIRELLNEAFNASEISALAFDRFRTIYQDFTTGMTKGQMTTLLLDWVRRNGQEESLLSEIKQRNPHQYARYESRLHLERPQPPAPPAYQQQRLQDLQRHIEQDSSLLRQYEDQLRREDNPRRLLAVEHEIQRQKEALANYRQQYDALQGAVGTSQLPAEVQVQTSLESLSQKIDALSQQLEGVKTQVVQSEQALRQDLSAGQQAVLLHIEQQHRQTVAVLVKKLDEQQVEVVELLLDAHDEQKIAQWQADQLFLLSQQALVDLHRLRQELPDGEQWQTVLALLQREMGWQQKLKLTLSLIPGILAFESEAGVDVMPALKESWQKLVDRFRNE